MPGAKAKASKLQGQQNIIRASIASLQSVELRERIIQYLDEHPEMLAPCWHALENKLFDPTQSQTDKLKYWLPESNSRIKHVARYFIEECLAKMDSRFTDSVCGKLCVPGDTKIIFQLFYFAARLHEFSGVTTRHRRTFKDLMLARYKEQGERLKKIIILDIKGDELKQDHCIINWTKDGCYQLGEMKDGKFTKIFHISGAQALMKHTSKFSICTCCSSLCCGCV